MCVMGSITIKNCQNFRFRHPFFHLFRSILLLSMIQHGTDWNRHRGVGATLLENWVEERAVGDLIIDERSDIPLLSRQGHSVFYLNFMDILILKKEFTHSFKSRYNSSNNSKG